MIDGTGTGLTAQSDHAGAGAVGTGGVQRGLRSLQ